MGGKSDKFSMLKISLISRHNNMLRIQNVVYINFLTYLHIFWITLSVFHDSVKPQMDSTKPKIRKKMQLFQQNHQKSTNDDFFENSIDSLWIYCLKTHPIESWAVIMIFHDFMSLRLFHDFYRNLWHFVQKLTKIKKKLEDGDFKISQNHEFLR